MNAKRKEKTQENKRDGIKGLRLDQEIEVMMFFSVGEGGQRHGVTLDNHNVGWLVKIRLCGAKWTASRKMVSRLPCIWDFSMY